MCFFAQMTVIVMFVISIKTSIFVCNNKHYLKMATKKQVVLPKHSKLLEQMGENITLARKRRKLTTIQVAERAGLVRSTLYLIEKGASGVAFVAYFNVIREMGRECCGESM